MLVILASTKVTNADFLVSKDHPLEMKDKMVISPQLFVETYFNVADNGK